jgi:hypothetical protein
VAGAGDVNGDGYDDVIVGAYRFDAGEVDEGAAFVLLGSASPLSRNQRNCINAMNRCGEKVVRARLKENERCLTSHQQGKLATSFEECLTADPRGSVQRAEDKTLRSEEKKCGPLAVPPPSPTPTRQP